MTSIYEDDANVGTLTKAAIAETGSKLLQIHRFSEQDDEHARDLLEVFNFKHNASVLDVGCGVGELAELMSRQRPDLSFTLTNPSATQLDMCPPGFPTVKCSAEQLPFKDGEFDVVMCAYVIGHLNFGLFIKECTRVLNRDGKVCLYEIFKTDDPCRYGSDLNYEEYKQEQLIGYFEKNGFKFSHSRTTGFALPKVGVLMPHQDTLKNTISAAMVFTR